MPLTQLIITTVEEANDAGYSFMQATLLDADGHLTSRVLSVSEAQLAAVQALLFPVPEDSEPEIEED